MKLRLAVRLLVMPLAAAALLTPLRPARAQDMGSAPPAYAVAQRLQAEAQDALRKGDTETAHRRALQATYKYQEVKSSRTFGSGPWGAEALYQEALVQRDFLHDDNAAVQSLQTVQNNYRGVPFQNSAQAAVNLTSLETSVDSYNKVHSPGSILYGVMDFFVKLFGGKHFSYSYALAILAISVLVRLALTPLSNKQYASMREMQKLQPAIKELQAKHKDNKEVQGRKVMELYKAHGVNPAGGCLPMLVQLPILYLLYYMIRLYQYQFVNGHFLWVGSPLARLIPGGIVAPNLGMQDIPLLVLYGVSMYVTQKLTVTPSLDPQQAAQQKQMAIFTPFISTYLFLQWKLPSAFVLYYLVFNVLSTAQQKYYMRQRHADIHGEPDVDRGDGGSAVLLPSLPANGGGRAKVLPVGGGGRPALPGRATPIAQAKNGAATNGTAPTAKGVIAPPKVHPKKKRR